MPGNLVIYGGGGFAREVDAALDGRWNVLGYIDDARTPDAIPGRPLLGDFDAFAAWLDSEAAPERVGVFIAIGNIPVHAKLTARLEALGERVTFPSIVHADATIGPRVKIARGAYVGAGARLTADVTIGDFALINVNTVVAHDSAIGERSQVNPGAVINGQVRVGSGVVVGAGAVLMPRIEVGDGAIVGLGAVAGANVPEGATVVGNPGRVLRKKAPADAKTS